MGDDYSGFVKIYRRHETEKIQLYLQLNKNSMHFQKVELENFNQLQDYFDQIFPVKDNQLKRIEVIHDLPAFLQKATVIDTQSQQEIQEQEVPNDLELAVSNPESQ